MPYTGIEVSTPLAKIKEICGFEEVQSRPPFCVRNPPDVALRRLGWRTFAVRLRRHTPVAILKTLRGLALLSSTSDYREGSERSDTRRSLEYEARRFTDANSLGHETSTRGRPWTHKTKPFGGGALGPILDIIVRLVLTVANGFPTRRCANCSTLSGRKQPTLSCALDCSHVPVASWTTPTCWRTSLELGPYGDHRPLWLADR